MARVATGRRVGTDLTEGPAMRVLVTFAVPMILTNLIQQLYSMADLVIIGHFVGNIGTVGVSTGGEIADMVMPIASAFATGGQIYIAQLIGAKAHDKIKHAIGTFLTMMLLMSVIALVITIGFHRQILNALNCPPEAYDQAVTYMVITAVGMPFIFGYNAICGILRGMGESKRPLIFIIIAAIVNIILDLLLVVVFHMEAAGVAIATVIAQAASFIAAFVYLYQRREHLEFEFKLSFFKLRWEPAKVILALGVPQAARSLLVRLSMLWVNANINSYGMTVSATNSVGNKLQKFLEVYSQGMSHASAAMIGQNLGAKKYDRAKKVVLYALYISLGVATISSALALFCPNVLFGIFTNDASVLEMGTIYLRIMIVQFFLAAVTNSFQAMVIGSGRSMLNFVIGILDGIVCKIGLSILFAYLMNMGAYGYFWATALSRAIPGLICIFYFVGGKWKTVSLVEGVGRHSAPIHKEPEQEEIAPAEPDGQEIAIQEEAGTKLKMEKEDTVSAGAETNQYQEGRIAYMGIRHPLIHEIATDTWLINEFGLNNMYVLRGSERSLVIDAGMGYCDFAAIVESLVDNPYEVVVTHAHPDHVGMMHQFDRIYINEKDWEKLPYLGRLEFDLNEFIWNNRQHIGNWEVWEVTEDMINRGNKNTEVLPLNEGDIFDLGNRKVTACELPGHSAGHMYFIDDFSRIAFTGDCVNPDNGSRYAVSTHIRNVLRLLDGYGKTYDRIFTGHSTYCGNLDVKSHNIQILWNIVEAYRSLLRGDAEFDMKGHHLHPEQPPHKVVVYGEGENAVCLAFNETMFWEEGEEHIIP